MLLYCPFVDEQGYIIHLWGDQNKDMLYNCWNEAPKGRRVQLSLGFDHSLCHTAFAEDALISSRMNAKPGGAQPVRYDTVYNSTNTIF